MFHKIDFKNWDRAEYYDRFMNGLRCNYSMTANVDVTELLSACKKNGYKFYAASIYLFSRVVNGDSHFRMDYDGEGNLGYYDDCHPSYTIFDAETTLFSGIWTRCDCAFSRFHKDYLTDVHTFAGAGVYAPKAEQPTNTFYVSTLPWLTFTGLDVQIFDEGRTLTPRVTTGKYFVQAGRTLLPVSVQLHHAVCDGYHASKFFLDAERLAAHPDLLFCAKP